MTKLQKLQIQVMGKVAFCRWVTSLAPPLLLGVMYLFGHCGTSGLAG